MEVIFVGFSYATYGLAIVALLAMLAAVTMVIVDTDRWVRAAKWVVVFAVILLLVTAGLQTAASRSWLALAGALLVLCGGGLMLGSGLFGRILPGGTPSRPWMTGGIVFLVAGVVLILL
jgi:hypothetical protein